jgi:serine/threonine-protein kinase RsbW
MDFSSGSADPGSFSLKLPAARASLPISRRTIADYATRLGLEQEETDNLKTVVTEACANVVEHAYVEEQVGSNGAGISASS